MLAHPSTPTSPCAGPTRPAIARPGVRPVRGACQEESIQALAGNAPPRVLGESTNRLRELNPQFNSRSSRRTRNSLSSLPPPPRSTARTIVRRPSLRLGPARFGKRGFPESRDGARRRRALRHRPPNHTGEGNQEPRPTGDHVRRTDVPDRGRAAQAEPIECRRLAVTMMATQEPSHERGPVDKLEIRGHRPAFQASLQRWMHQCGRSKLVARQALRPRAMP